MPSAEPSPPPPAAGTRRMSASCSQTRATSSWLTRGRHAPPDYANHGQRVQSALGPQRDAPSPSRATTTSSSCRSMAATGAIVQLTDVGPRKRDPRETDSQKFLQGRGTEADRAHADRGGERRRETRRRQKERRCRRFELQDRQTATDLLLSPDDTPRVHAGRRARRRREGRAIVPNYVTESGYAEDIPARTNVGDAQDAGCSRS